MSKPRGGYALTVYSHYSEDDPAITPPRPKRRAACEQPQPKLPPVLQYVGQRQANRLKRVAQLIADGYASSEIASYLGVDRRTIDRDLAEMGTLIVRAMTESGMSRHEIAVSLRLRDETVAAYEIRDVEVHADWIGEMERMKELMS